MVTITNCLFCLAGQEINYLCLFKNRAMLLIFVLERNNWKKTEYSEYPDTRHSYTLFNLNQILNEILQSFFASLQLSLFIYFLNVGTRALFQLIQ